MKKITLILALICCSAALILAQNNNATVTDFEVDVTNQAVIISFDLESVGKYKLFNIRVEGKLDEDKLTIQHLNKKENIKAGKNNEVIWFAGKDGYKALQGELSFEIIVSNPLDRDMDGIGDLEDKCLDTYGVPPSGCPLGNRIDQPCLNLPAAAGLGGTALTGLGLMISGAAKSSDVKNGELYKMYLTHKNPNDPIYQENGYTNRREAYDAINKEYKTGQYMMYGGLAILSTAATIWIVRKVSCKRLNKPRYTQGRFRPQMRVTTGGSNPSSVSAGVVYNF